jgi:UDP-N-acetylglucosamine transferase subunit ALG13
MIFVVTGSQKFAFDRLIQATDGIAEKGRDAFFAQIGTANYLPRYMEYQRFMDKIAFQRAIVSCDVLITHAAAGTMMPALHMGKKIIAVPRLSKYGEHIDDHQVELAEELAKENYLFYLSDLEQLEEAIYKVQDHIFDPYAASPQGIVNIIHQTIRNKF